MKKKIISAIFPFVFALIVVITLITRLDTTNKPEDLSFQNVKMLQASAGEAWCDPVVIASCQITVGGTSLSGVGVARTN